LKNNGKQDYSVLKWSTPLEGMISDCLTVTRNGKKLEYDGIYRKRGVPGPDQFLTVGAGQTLSSTFQVSDAFDMTKAGEYSIAVDTYLEYVEGSTASKPDIKKKIRHLSTSVISFQLVGRGFSKGTLGQKARFLESRKQTKQNVIFDGTYGEGVSRKNVLLQEPWIEGFSPISDADTKKAHEDAYKAITDFLLAPQDKKLLVTTWFGPERRSRIPFMRINPLNIVVENFQRMKDVLERETITYSFHAPYCDATTCAYTYKNTRKVFLCELYKQAANIGDDNKKGILTHELSHAIVSTDDIAYGKDACKTLAGNRPAKAVKNADNFEYFVEAL